ncbi:MAG: polysaccharide deacetylase family protein [Bacteroidia bacterium]|nr:polysaccharide deacetylase family protein [Bacteroidia bacterium]
MDTKTLNKLLNLDVDPIAPGFIIYSEEASPRLNYVAEFIFKHVLKVNIKITASVSEFEISPLYKINYSEKSIPVSLQILPAGFLFENGVTENKPEVVLKNSLIYFFENKQAANTNFNYDIFSAVFYFISRYEEWQSFEADAHGRFEAKESILFKNNLHLKPVVDIWIYELKSELEKFYYELKFPQTKFKAISTIDVDNLYAYKKKGFFRTSGAILKDVLKFDFKNLNYRLKVLQNKQKDPFDIYSEVSEFCNDKNIPLFVFFLCATGNKYDRTVDPRSGAFIEVTKNLKKQDAIIGLHPSYYSSQNADLLSYEMQSLSKTAAIPINLSRQHYLRFNIKTTPALLMQNGIIADFTMGFASAPGFRAGTSFPFYYFNLNENKPQQLLMVPFCTMDGVYFVYNRVEPEKMLSSLKDLASEVRKVNGLFVSVFHERTFSNHLYPGYDRIYNNFYQTVNDL